MHEASVNSNGRDGRTCTIYKSRLPPKIDPTSTLAYQSCNSTASLKNEQRQAFGHTMFHPSHVSCYSNFKSCLRLRIRTSPLLGKPSIRQRIEVISSPNRFLRQLLLGFERISLHVYVYNRLDMSTIETYKYIFEKVFPQY